jgi:ubiquinol-cytochrome c reductase iron-sulfur subunit
LGWGLIENLCWSRLYDVFDLYVLFLQHRVALNQNIPAPPYSNFQQRFLHTSVARKDAPDVPDFSKYRASNLDTNRALSYFMVGTTGVLSASLAKSTVTEFLQTMAASADVLALAKVEVELAHIPEGKNVIIKWRGKPVFIRHRTPDEIQEARATEWKSLRDPQTDDSRVKKPEWLVMLGVCTHLGCVPIGEAGDFGGWYVTFARPVSRDVLTCTRKVLPLSRFPL